MKKEMKRVAKRCGVLAERAAALRSSASAKLAPGLVAAALGLALAPAARASNPIWINPLICGTPIASYYLGDSLGSPWYVNFEIGQTSWNYAQVGYGTAANGTGYNWGVANWYEDGGGSNKRVRRNIGGLQFTSAGNWYVICQAREGGGDTYTSGSACGWLNGVTYPPASMAYFTVNALNNPASPGAAAASASQIDLGWSKDAQGHNVMVVRKLSTATWTEPTQGAAYAVGNALGAGTVVYNGSGTAYANTGLSAGTTYDYKFYSENYSYYSAGVTASATTPKLDQTIDFPAIGNQLTTNAVTLAATASSGLAVSFAVASGPASLAGTALTFTGAGSVSIVASQAGNATYNAAPNVTNVFDVAEPKLAPVLSKSAVNVREAGEGRFFVRLNQAPGADAVVAVSRSAGSESLAIAGGAALTFKPSNWDVWQPVTLAQAADEGADDETATFRVSLEGADNQYLAATALDDDIGGNLARSATMRGAPLLVVDGIHAVSTNYVSTKWTNVPPGTMTMDLQSTATVSRVRLLNWDWGCRTHNYTIQSSVNGTTWTTLADASTGEHSGWEDWAVANQAMRFLRFTGLSNSANSSVCIAEWEVYGTDDPLPGLELSAPAVNVREEGEGRFFVRMDGQPVTSVDVSVARVSGSATIGVQKGATLTFKPANWDVWQPVTLAAGADENSANETATFQVSAPGAENQSIVATALDVDVGENLARSGMLRGAPALAIDGIHAVSTNYVSTKWTNVPPGTMTLDLQAARTVTRIRLLNWDWGYRVHQYRIQASLDGKVWTTVADASAGEYQGWDDWAVADQAIRYLRFTGLSNSANSSVCIAEWEVYGLGATLPQIELSAAAVNVREEGQGRFFVRLAGQPALNTPVSVSRVSGDENVAVQSGAALTFSPLNWNLWQPVTLAAGADENSANETAAIHVASPGVSTRTVTATALDADIGENLARAATLRGGSALVIDGIHTVSNNYAGITWTNVPAETMTLDLQSTKTVFRVRLLNWDWNNRAHRYRVQSSVDGKTWSTLVDASTGEHRGWEDWAIADQAIRYLRLTGLSNSLNSDVCIAEWEVYGSTPAGRRSASTAAPAGSEPVAVLTSAGPEDETGWNAVDGDDATAWVGPPAGGGYLVVEYQPTLTLSGLDVAVAAGALADAQVLTSLDGQDWQPLPEDLETNPVALNFLWVIFPDAGTGAMPPVIEIRPNP